MEIMQNKCKKVKNKNLLTTLYCDLNSSGEHSDLDPELGKCIRKKHGNGSSTPIKVAKLYSIFV